MMQTAAYRPPVDLDDDTALRARRWMAQNPLALLARDTFSPTEVRRLLFHAWRHAGEGKRVVH